MMPCVTIVLTRYEEPDWLVAQALESLSRQQGVVAEVLFLDQTPTPEVAQRCNALSTANVTITHDVIPRNSLSFARNEGIRRAANELVFFVDADAVVESKWAAALARCLTQPGVGVAGTRILPRWHRRPLLIARASVVKDQYSIFDLGIEQTPIERVVGASFGIHRGRLGPEAYFDERFGRRKGMLYTGEESDLCLRVRRTGLEVVYEGRVVTYHQILPARISYRWVIRRFFYAGVARAQLGGAPKPANAMGVWDYLVLPLIGPSYVAGYQYGKYTSTPQRSTGK